VYTNRKTGFWILGSLVFYFLFVGCTEKKDPGSVSILWEGEKAVAIIVPQQLLSSVPKDSIKELLHIRLANADQPVIGDYSFKDDEVIFKPIIAFTRGLKYHLYVRNEFVDEIEIQAANTAAPEIIAVYPVLDTLPENLLKFYILFSKPMQEGDELKHIHLIKDGRDTLSAVFLDLELWNNERTMLTLWLDPGRIKRDLQPNMLLGQPLIKGSHYQLLIDKDWQDAEGILLKENLAKNFFTTSRDSVSPDEKKWTINVPKAGTKEQLKIKFNEPLDHVLAERTISVTDASGNEIKGKLKVNDHGDIVYFSPDSEWKRGDHVLHIESRLEDLAGNNLDRLFDVDLNQKRETPKNIHKRQFETR
jgi:Bacterial Ig-like domain